MPGSKQRLRDLWMWDWALLRFFVYGSVLVAVGSTVALYPREGGAAFWGLSFALAGALMWATYGVVGQKVRGLVASLEGEAGEVVETLMHQGGIQSPGVVILRETEVHLIPIVGRPLTVPLTAIRGVKHPRTLFGKSVTGKHVFVLDTELSSRLGFAVVESVAARWAHRLAPPG